MKKLIANLFIVVLVSGLLATGVMPASARPSLATPTPAATPAPASPDEISFFQINESEIQLKGPYDSSSLVFGLPAGWQLTPIAKLELNLAVSFNTVAQQTANAPVLQGGTLTVRLNGVNLGAYPLNKTGERIENVEIPLRAFTSQRTDGRMELDFILDSGISCYVSQQMTVFIHTNSRLVLPHDQVAPDTSLLDFPQPLYQASILPESALVVVPDAPSAAELQAALTVAAGLGNLSGNGLALDMTTVGKLTPEQQAVNHLILVGKAASLPLLTTLQLPLPVTGGQFQFDSGAADNGVVELINAPWSVSEVVLLVTGNTDAAVVKAAQALSTGLLRPNTSPNLAVIEQVQPELVKVSAPVDQTLADITLANTGTMAAPGKAIKTLRFANVGSTSYQFYIPPGQTVTSEAYFDLVFGHSALLNFSRSGLVISINGQPVGSVRMSDETAVQANNHMRFNIPATVILPGFNRLEIRANLVPSDACTSPQLDGLWVTIWPDSMLHLPLAPVQVAPLSTVDLAAYPAPFVYQSNLATTAFVLQHDDLESWRIALRIASYLGDRTNGALFTIAAFYGDELKDPERANYNLLVIGQPSKMPIVGEMNSSLPAPFDPSSDTAIESNMQVKFNIPASSPTGYVQLFTSPWNQNYLVIAALGNSPQGVLWAASALVDAPLRSRMAGNFAAISGSQVVTTDTRLSPFAQVPDAVFAESTPSASAIDLTPPPANRPSWILPVIYVASALMLVVLLAAMIGAWVRSRSTHS